MQITGLPDGQGNVCCNIARHLLPCCFKTCPSCTAAAATFSHHGPGLCRQTRMYAGENVARYLLLFLTTSSGMFVASTALLPSTFAMYSMTAAAAAVLAGSPLAAETSAAIGIIWAWPVAAIGFMPYAIYVLLTARMTAAVGTALGLLGFTLVPLIAADRAFYGRWTVRNQACLHAALS